MNYVLTGVLNFTSLDAAWTRIILLLFSPASLPACLISIPGLQLILTSRRSLESFFSSIRRSWESPTISALVLLELGILSSGSSLFLL